MLGVGCSCCLCVGLSLFFEYFEFDKFFELLDVVLIYFDVFVDLFDGLMCFSEEILIEEIGVFGIWFVVLILVVFVLVLGVLFN